LYLVELSRRGLKILVITSASYEERARAAMADPANPASAITDIAFVNGDVSVEGSYTPGAIAAAAAWRARYEIVGIYAVGEILAEQTGLIGDGLGLPTPGLRASRACRSKYLQRWYAPELSPASMVIPAADRDTADLSTVVFPAVVKPASRHSSSGVETVNDLGELRTQLATYPPHEVVLVEQKVEGPEFSVESLTQNGKIIFESTTRKETTESHARTFVELVHGVPNEREETREALVAANRRLLGNLGFANGISHSEWRIGADGRPILMEIAARTPGDGILVLYLLATGTPLEPEILRIALGEPASYPAARRYARQVYLEHEPGILEDVAVRWEGVNPEWVGEGGVWPEIKPGDADDEPTLRAVLVVKDHGSRLVPLSNSDDRSVTFFIDAQTPAELDLLEARVRAAITITTR
jgi:hypothetical protein